MKDTQPSGCDDHHFHAAQDLLDRRDLNGALQAFAVAERHGADADRCASGRWFVHMLSGNFECAWQESDAIRQRGAIDPNRFWMGEPLEGKRVILRCLHGLGDAVQMLRYLPMLVERCASVIVEVPPRLLPLASCFDGVQEVITWGAEAPAIAPEWDVQVEVMELPYLFRTTLADLPLATDYLRLPPSVLDLIGRMEPRHAPRVGVVWAASSWDRTRCLPMECLEKLLAVPGIEFWNLQGGEQHSLGANHAAIRQLRDAADLGAGLLPLAAAIAAMDLVLTVDTLAAHLAGAIGRPAWVLLQHRADWRWMHARVDTPWYPTLQLWRQGTQDDWAGLTTRVCEALESWRKG